MKPLNSVQGVYEMQRDLTNKFSKLEREYENTPSPTEKERDVLLEDGLDTHYGLAVIKDVIEYIEA